LSVLACGGNEDTASNDSPGSGGATTGGSGGSGNAWGSGGSASGGTSGASTGESGGTSPRTWPGTETRYYPGIYPLIRTYDLDAIQGDFDDWFGGVEDEYREFVGTTPVSYLGMSVGIEPGAFFSAEWKTASSAPYDWKGACARFEEAADPDAAPDGKPLYDFTWVDSLLEQEFVKNGGKVILRMMETYSRSQDTPEWMTAEGYSMPGVGWLYNQMQDAALVYMWQDIMTAFAKRYAGDERIASVVFDETYPSLWEQQELCGHFGGIEDAAQAGNAGMMEIGKSILEVDPGMLYSIVNWFAATDTPLQTWEQGYELGDGSHTSGADDLPGVQGHWRQDIKFFQGEGSGDACSVDAPESKYMNFYLAQHAAIHHTGPVFSGDEANGWQVYELEGHRDGAKNPWNAGSWPDWDPPGSLPSDDGDLFPSAHFWLWYTSGAPRAETAAARDSGLGQDGEDPCGVVPSDFYVMAVPNWNPDDKPAWTSQNLSIAKWRKAFDTFGPNGTKAMFNFPPGYLEGFE
jgi:hypothetical protein